MSSLFIKGLVMKTIYQPAYQTLIRHLVDLRKSKELTQVALANMLSKPQSYVAKIEGCERKLDVLEFMAWCQALGVRPSEVMVLMEYDDKNPNFP